MKRRISILAAIVIILPVLLDGPVRAADGWSVDLSGRDLYLRQGFEHKWITGLPAGPGWKRYPASSKTARELAIRTSGLPEVPGRTFLSLKQSTPMTFTYVTSFEMDDAKIARNDVTAIYLSYIGGNWELFCNGVSLAREWHEGTGGSIAKITNIRKILVPLDGRILKRGLNVIAIKVRGDPTYATTGWYHARNYLVGDIRTLANKNSETASLVLIFMYLIFGIYHICFFFYCREDRNFLYFGLFSVMFFAYHFTQTTAAYRVIESVNVLDRLELVCLFSLMPLIIAFVDTLQTDRTRMFVKVLSIAYAILAILVIIAPLPFTFDIQLIFQISLFIPLGYVFFYQTLLVLFRECRTHYRLAIGSIPKRTINAIAKGFTSGMTGKLFIGCLLMIACGIFDNIDNIFFQMNLHLVQYAFVVLMFAITLNLANNFIYMHNQVSSLNAELENRIGDLEDSHAALSRSEEKYRLLVEGSSSYIFTIDKNGTILSANNVLVREQRFNASQLRTYSLFDLIFNAPTDKDFVNRLVLNKISECITTGDTIMLKVNIKSPHYNEPKESLLRLEYVKAGSGNEILCRISPSTKDSLLQYLDRENQCFVISNQLTVAEEITHRLVRNVERYIDLGRIQMLRLTLREIIINAIEHGNLEISYDDKTRETFHGDYLKYIERLQAVEEYRHRRVTIEYHLSPDGVTYHITDDGKGFDHKSIIGQGTDIANEEMLAHGRGITMAISFFDIVEFNERGNSVMLKKYFTKNIQ